MHVVPIKKESMQDVLDMLENIKNGAEIIEIWVDDLADFDLYAVKEICKKPLILKGAYDNLKDYFGRVEYVDMDYTSLSSLDISPEDLDSRNKSENDKGETQLILSHHNYEATPPFIDLKRIALNMYNSGADIAKIATFAQSTDDNDIILKLYKEFIPEKKKLIAICMGEHGRTSRILGPIFGSYFYYAPLSKVDTTATGQIASPELKRIWKEIGEKPMF